MNNKEWGEMIAKEIKEGDLSGENDEDEEEAGDQKMGRSYFVKLDDGHEFHYLSNVEAATEEEAKSAAHWQALRKFGRIARNWRAIEATEEEEEGEEEGE